MYTSFFGFRENPFNLTPDPRYLFLSPHHKEALDHLIYGIRERKGFITITGGIGTGKTTFCRALLSHLDPSTKSALIFNAFLSDTELLKTINQEFGVDTDSQGASKKDYVDALNRFLLDTFRRGGNAVLLIDEAQNLSHSVLEQIRMLSNLETEKEKLLQIVLVGQSELKELLASPALRQLDERITVRYELRPLHYRDVERYVAHRLVVAGGMGNLRFARGAFKRIYTHSRGNPRRINAVCDRALLIAYAQEKHTVTSGVVGRAIRDLHGEVRTGSLSTDWTWRRLVSFGVLLLLLITVAGFAGWSSREQISGMLSGSDGKAVTDEAEKTVAQRIINTEMIKPKEEAPLFLDEETSLAGLFGLFQKRTDVGDRDLRAGGGLSLVTFNVGPECYVMFKKPFRVMLTESFRDPSEPPQYLLVREVTEDGADAVDAEGKVRTVSKDFIMDRWGQKVSFVYPSDGKTLHLNKGSLSPEVLRVQRILGERGYLVPTTGVYDEATLRGVLNFQQDLGLSADGIVGPRTMSLLYQMTK